MSLRSVPEELTVPAVCASLNYTDFLSVVPDPGSWFLSIRDPGSWILSIHDLGSRIQQQHQKKRGGNVFVLPFFVPINIKFKTEAKKILLSRTLRKKVRIILLIAKNLSLSYQKICVWDPGSGKNLFRIRDPGSRFKKAPDPYPQQWVSFNSLLLRRWYVQICVLSWNAFFTVILTRDWSRWTVP